MLFTAERRWICKNPMFTRAFPLLTILFQINIICTVLPTHILHSENHTLDCEPKSRTQSGNRIKSEWLCSLSCLNDGEAVEMRLRERLFEEIQKDRVNPGNKLQGQSQLKGWARTAGKGNGLLTNKTQMSRIYKSLCSEGRAWNQVFEAEQDCHDDGWQLVAWLPHSWHNSCN